MRILGASLVDWQTGGPQMTFAHLLGVKMTSPNAYRWRGRVFDGGRAVGTRNFQVTSDEAGSTGACANFARSVLP